MALLTSQTDLTKKMEIEKFENFEGDWEHIGEHDTLEDLVKGKVLDQIEMLIRIQKQGSHSMIVKLETKASSSTLSLLKSMPAYSKANG